MEWIEITYDEFNKLFAYYDYTVSEDNEMVDYYENYLYYGKFTSNGGINKYYYKRR